MEPVGTSSSGAGRGWPEILWGAIYQGLRISLYSIEYVCFSKTAFLKGNRGHDCTMFNFIPSVPLFLSFYLTVINLLFHYSHNVPI